MYYVYIIKSIKYNEIYIGSTNDLQRRMSEHNNGVELSTKRYKPWRLIYYEAYQSEKDARGREMKLKYHGNAMKELKKRIQHSLKNGGVLPRTIGNGAGFTLIELLVVIAILGLLATIGLGSFQSSQIKGRDAQRKHDLGQIQKALEMYYNDYKAYPDPDAINFGATWEDAQGTIYIKTVPNDPKGCSYKYVQKSSGTGYALYARLENLQDKSIKSYTESCCGTNDCNYAVASTNITP